MFQINRKDYTLVLNRDGLKTTLNYNPIEGMMFRRQLPEYMQYLAKKGDNIWRSTDSRILLIGGGLSNIRQWLKKLNVQCEITNLDFYTDYKSTVSHIHVKEDFYDWNIKADFYDQEWALWSLPSYALSKTELEIFFIKSVLGLAPNGVLRVFPINRCPGDANSSDIQYSKDQRRKDSLNILQKLEKLGFSVDIFYPQNMESIMKRIQKRNLNQDKQIYDMMIKYISKRRCRYIEQEFEHYQNKDKEKTAIAVNVSAPSESSVKETINVQLIRMLENLKS